MTMLGFLLSTLHFFFSLAPKKFLSFWCLFILHTCDFRAFFFYMFYFVIYALGGYCCWIGGLNHMHTHTGDVYRGSKMFFFVLALAALVSSFLFFTIDDGLGQKNKQAIETGRRRRLMAAELGENMQMQRVRERNAGQT
ncbi:hypothetical protein V8C35DRAFT_307995 [Trichoderma chlorosporum]